MKINNDNENNEPNIQLWMEQNSRMDSSIMEMLNRKLRQRMTRLKNMNDRMEDNRLDNRNMNIHNSNE